MNNMEPVLPQVDYLPIMKKAYLSPAGSLLSSAGYSADAKDNYICIIAYRIQPVIEWVTEVGSRLLW